MADKFIAATCITLGVANKRFSFAPGEEVKADVRTIEALLETGAVKAEATAAPEKPAPKKATRKRKQKVDSDFGLGDDE